MNVWILVVYDGGDRLNEIASVIFDEALIAPKIAELFAEDEQVMWVIVETWHRDAADGPDASFYETETFWKEDI